MRQNKPSLSASCFIYFSIVILISEWLVGRYLIKLFRKSLYDANTFNIISDTTFIVIAMTAFVLYQIFKRQFSASHKDK